MSPRIVSLLASATEIVDALGLGEQLVGISHECDFPDHLLGLPRVSRPRFDPSGLSSGEIDAAVRQAMTEHGSVYEIDLDALESLNPDIVLTQAVCDVCAVPAGGAREALAARGLEAEIVSLDAHTIEGIFDTMVQVGVAAGGPEACGARVAELRARLDAVEGAVRGAPRPRVLGIEWLDPPFTPGHWVPEMVAWAGGENLLGDLGQPSRQVEWTDLEGLDPDVLLIMPCGYRLDAARSDADTHAERLCAVAPRATAGGRAFVVNASAYFNRSGPRFVTGIEILGGLLHADRLPRPAPDDAAVWWKPSADSVSRR